MKCMPATNVTTNHRNFKTNNTFLYPMLSLIKISNFTLYSKMLSVVYQKIIDKFVSLTISSKKEYS